MKQILQSLKTGATTVAEVPAPGPKQGQLLIRTSHTLVSAGTERMLVEFGKAGWIEKARQQPDKVRMVLQKIKTDGLQPTIEAVLNKLDQPLPLGYCNVGRVVAVGGAGSSFRVGDRVASNGKHAEIVNVPYNLSARIPDSVSDEEAAFTVLGAIALQGIRLVNPTLGETVVVTGLGLIGLLTVQLLRAHGCRVLGLDFDKERLDLARQFGAEVVNLGLRQDPLMAADEYSRGRGVDAVIVTAATTSSEPMHQAALMCRKRGRIVLVGVAGLELSRDDYFKKELTFQVSASYGPGRYDPNYEDKGNDYPVGFVRWTEQRNFEAVLDMMSDGRLNVKPLVSHRFGIGQAEEAYELVGGGGRSLGIVLNYPGIELDEQSDTITINRSDSGGTRVAGAKVKLGFIGAGNYASGVLIPAFKYSGAGLRSIASSAGVSGIHSGRRFGFEEATTNTDRMLSDGDIDAVVITTQHNSHAAFVVKALSAGKHVFVEKPLCLNQGELEEIQATVRQLQENHRLVPMIMVGFNRRFAPQVLTIQELLKSCTGPKAFVMTVNAGAIPSDHWTQDPQVGGGRVIGEACHFIDLIRFLAASPMTSWRRTDMQSLTDDTLSIQLTFADGSIGTILYFSNGNKAFAKERLEIFVNGRILQLDNFRVLNSFGWPGFKRNTLWRQDKGQKSCAKAFVSAIADGRAAPIPLEDILEVSRVCIELGRRMS